MVTDAAALDAPSPPPLWLVEGVDLVERRRGMGLGVFAAVVAVGVALAVLVPSVVPPTWLVGAAVGVAAVLLSLAALVAADTTEAIVRGPRHVAAAGGELVAVLPAAASVDAALPLAGAVLDARTPGQPLLLALASAGRDARGAVQWTDALAEALVQHGTSVLRVDLVSPPSDRPGLLEVANGERLLRDTVTFVPGVRFAHLAAGTDRGAAIEALPLLRGRLPADLDVMLVALPPAANRQVVRSARALDHVLLLVQRDVTAKVDLIASLDALESVGTHAQAVLLDDRTASRLAPGAVPLPADPAAQDVAPEDAAPDDAAPEDPALEDSAPEDPALEDAAPEDLAPDDVALEDAGPQDVPPEDPALEGLASEDPALEVAVLEDVVPGGVVSEEATPDDGEVPDAGDPAPVTEEPVDVAPSVVDDAVAEDVRAEDATAATADDGGDEPAPDVVVPEDAPELEDASEIVDVAAEEALSADAPPLAPESAPVHDHDPHAPQDEPDPELAVDDDEELLRTTAQLAAFLDDLDLRGAERGDDASIRVEHA